jgi:hypothetical protein
LAAPTGLAIRLSPRPKGGTVVDDKRERVFVFRDGRESAATGPADILQLLDKPPFHVAASWPTNWVVIIISIVVPPRMRGRLVGKRRKKKRMLMLLPWRLRDQRPARDSIATKRK